MCSSGSIATLSCFHKYISTPIDILYFLYQQILNQNTEEVNCVVILIKQAAEFE